MQLRATRLTAIASAVKRAFNIRSLFAGSVQGAWYDPSDMSTLFQDSAGTTPVTAVEQPVGLMLDKSQGLVLGPTLVTNGDFSNGTTGWTAETNNATTLPVLSNPSGTLLLTASSSNFPRASQNVTVTTGKTYLISAQFVKGTANGPIYLGPIAGVSTSSSDASGTLSLRFTATSSTFNIVVGIFGTGVSGTVTFDNISVKELPGNHAFQATSASRPVLSARYNLLTKTEQLTDAAVWKKLITGTAVAPVVTANYGIAPDGTQTATRIQLDRGDGVCIFYQEFQAAVSVPLSDIAYIKTNDGSTKTISFGDSAAGPDVITVTGTWQKFTSIKSVAQVGKYIEFATRATTSQVADILVWQPQSVPANQSTLPYQRVNTATDYATTGFLPYLKFDGVDDSLSTNSISFTATDKMSVFAGVRKLSDANIGMVAELSVTSDTNNGAFYVVFPVSNVDTDLRFNVRGTANNQRDYGPYVAPTSRVLYAGLTTNAATSALAITARIDGTSQTGSNTTTAASTGNFGNYPLFIGRRNNASLPFNGQMYSMIIVGKAVTAGELSSTEKFVASKTGVALT